MYLSLLKKYLQRFKFLLSKQILSKSLNKLLFLDSLKHELIYLLL